MDQGFQKHSISQTVFKDGRSEKVNGILTVSTDVTCLHTKHTQGQTECVFCGLTGCFKLRSFKIKFVKRHLQVVSKHTINLFAQTKFVVRLVGVCVGVQPCM